MRTYRTEFPDFDYELPVVDGLADHSWKNDACPHLESADGMLHLWCDYADASQREIEGASRYMLLQGEYGMGSQVCLYEGDDLEAALAALARYRARRYRVQQSMSRKPTEPYSWMVVDSRKVVTVYFAHTEDEARTVADRLNT